MANSLRNGLCFMVLAASLSALAALGVETTAADPGREAAGRPHAAPGYPVFYEDYSDRRLLGVHGPAMHACSRPISGIPNPYDPAGNPMTCIPLM